MTPNSRRDWRIFAVQIKFSPSMGAIHCAAYDEATRWLGAERQWGFVNKDLAK